MEDSSNSAEGNSSPKEEMSVSSPVVAAGRMFKISGVKLKVIGETLNILLEFKGKVDLCCTPELEYCRFFFHRGELTMQ